MDVNKADAHTIDDDIIEVIVAIDTNPSKKSKPLNSKHKEQSALKDLETEGSDDGEESSEEKDSKDKKDGDGPDWKSLCEQLLQAISVLDPDADEVVDSEMTDEEMLRAIDVVLDGKSAPEDKDPFSSYQEGSTRKENSEEKKPRSSDGFKGAAKKFMSNKDKSKPDDGENFDIPEFDSEKEDESDDGKEQFHKGGSKREEERFRKAGSKREEERFHEAGSEREEEPKREKGKDFGFQRR